MGHQVVYCCKCNHRLTQDIFDAQQAFFYEGKPFCKRCILAHWGSLPKAKQEELWRTIAPTPEAPAPTAKPPSRRVIVVGEDRGSKMWIVAAASGLFLVAGVVVLLSLGGSKPAPRPATAPERAEIPEPEVPKRPPPPTKLDALDRAREIRRAKPNDLAAQIEAYQAAAFELDASPRGAEARKELEEIRELRRRLWAEEFRRVEEASGQAAAREEFKSAIDQIALERKKYGDSEWTQRCDERTQVIQRLASDVFRNVKTDAADALKRGDRQSFDAIRRRVQSWGLDPFIAELAALDVPPPEEYVFDAARMKAADLFKRVDRPNVGTTWICGSDLEEARRFENFVEWEFPAKTGVAYKCHVYVGGCCQETILVCWQCDELKNSEGKPMEPGAPLYLKKKSSSAAGRLPKSHSEHAVPQEPSFWEWRTLDLPAFSAPGVKKIRLLTKEQGFSVAYAVVNTKSAPPSLSELKK